MSPGVEPVGTAGGIVTVRDALTSGTARLRGSGSESARLDAELLLAHAVGLDRTGILAHPEAPLGSGQLATYEAAVERRERGEPVAYIRGTKEFFGLSFAVDRRALIPRPETERLVELGLDRLLELATSAPRPPGTPRLRVVDVGTGSGAVAVAVAAALRRMRLVDEVEIIATDSSADALQLGLENAVGHGVADRIDFRQGDLLEPLRDEGRPVELILANLPYIPAEDLPDLPVAASFEPALALDGGEDGLLLIRRLIAQLPDLLAPGGSALLEMAAYQAEEISAAAVGMLPGWAVSTHEDLAGLPRVTRIDRPAAGEEPA